MGKTAIVGAYNTKFGNLVKKNKETGEVSDLATIYQLIEEAGKGALADAGVEGREVEGIWVGSCAPGILANQEHLAAAATEIDPVGLRFKAFSRVEDACASGSVALYNAIYALESGRVRMALVLGVEKMNLLDTKGVTHALATCSHWPSEGALGMTFPGLFAEYAKGYSKKYGISAEELRRQLAAVSALCYRNGLDNPLAHFGKGGPSDKLGLVTMEAVLGMPDDKNPMIAEPLRLHDCSLVSDGAAALVLMRLDDAKASGKKYAEVAGFAQVGERLAISERPNMYELIAGKEAVRRAFAEAGVTAKDIDIAEVHDCFTINQVLSTEALGFSADGKGGADYAAGRFSREDRPSVNLSGGLKAKGHPVGATGVSMHALLYKQLTDAPIGAAPAKAPSVGAAFNVGGSAVTNCVTVMKRGR